MNFGRTKFVLCRTSTELNGISPMKNGKEHTKSNPKLLSSTIKFEITGRVVLESMSSAFWNLSLFVGFLFFIWYVCFSNTSRRGLSCRLKNSKNESHNCFLNKSLSQYSYVGACINGFVKCSSKIVGGGDSKFLEPFERGVVHVFVFFFFLYSE